MSKKIFVISVLVFFFAGCGTNKNNDDGRFHDAQSGKLAEIWLRAEDDTSERPHGLVLEANSFSFDGQQDTLTVELRDVWPGRYNAQGTDLERSASAPLVEPSKMTLRLYQFSLLEIKEHIPECTTMYYRKWNGHGYELRLSTRVTNLQKK